jgi:hypothetical protein
MTGNGTLGTAWGRVGTAISGLSEARKYEDPVVFEERYARVQEEVEALREELKKAKPAE